MQIDDTSIAFRLETFRRTMEAQGTDPELREYLLGLIQQLFEMGKECAIRDEMIEAQTLEITNLQHQLDNLPAPSWQQQTGLIIVGLTIGLIAGFLL